MLVNVASTVTGFDVARLAGVPQLVVSRARCDTDARAETKNISPSNQVKLSI